MGSLAEPCTEDMEPFMKTCKALCMVLWPCTAIPVSGLAKPAGGKKSENIYVTEERGIEVYRREGDEQRVLGRE